MKQLVKMVEIDLAKELFQSWDLKGLGELEYLQVQEHFIGLGLAGSTDQVLKLLKTLKASTGTLNVPTFTLKDFLACF